jgi:hypothetical protein
MIIFKEMRLHLYGMPFWFKVDVTPSGSAARAMLADRYAVELEIADQRHEIIELTGKAIASGLIKHITDLAACKTRRMDIDEVRSFLKLLPEDDRRSFEF